MRRFKDGIPAKGIERFNAYAATGDLPGMLVSGMKLGRMGPAAMRATPDRLLKPLIKRIMRAEEAAGTRGYASMAELGQALRYDFAIAQSIDGSITKFKDVRQPVLLLGGSRSPHFLKRALDELEQIIPDVTRVEIEGVDHAAAWNVDPRRNPHGNPTAVAEVLKTYFNTRDEWGHSGNAEGLPAGRESSS